MTQVGGRGLSRRRAAALCVLALTITVCAVVLSTLMQTPPRLETTLKRLTAGAWDDLDPVFSPDEKRVAFSSNRSGNFEVWTMDADGSHQTRLTYGSGEKTHPQWSPDGSMLVYVVVDNSSRSLWVIKADGTRPQTVAAKEMRVSSFEWAPGGTAIAYDTNVGGRWKVLIAAVDGPTRQITADNESARYPSWSPNGSLIYFSLGKASPGGYHIWSLSLGDGRLTQLTSGTGNDTRASPSPNGRYIAFISDRGGQRSLWVMDSNGSNVHEAMSNPQNQDPGLSWVPQVSPDSYPTWNPQSQGILFFSDVEYPSPSFSVSVFVYYREVTVVGYMGVGAISPANQVKIVGDSMTAFTFGGSSNRCPSWGQNGTAIVASSLSEPSGHFNLWLRILPGATPRSSYG